MPDAQLTVAAAYVAALNEKNIDGALAHLAEDAEMQTPMGLKSGKKQIRGMLEMLAKMPMPTPTPPPANEAGEIVAHTKSVMGTAKLVFQVEGELIRRIDVKMGG